jgi:two-component system sensor histidine kinase/response regulator
VVKPFNEEELQLRVKTQIDLKKQRERLELLNQHLEETVKNKTSEVQKAHKKLAILEKAKNDFLVLISHELRTPLNIINGFTEILQDSLRQTTHTEELNILKHSTNRLIRLAETALLITEIRLGKYTLEYDEIDLEHLCHKVAKNAEKLFLNYQFGYSVDVNHNTTTIRGDKNLVENVISQITENAIKASQNNSHITFKIYNEAQNTLLEIKDNGHGFSQKDMNRLFEIFNKNGPDVKYDGFGLGLATAKLIMDLHSGEVLIKNNAEGGASVSLVFKR